MNMCRLTKLIDFLICYLLFWTRVSQNQDGGQHYPGKHGFFDGDYWRLLFEDNERLGFIEGYLACQREFKKPEASFSREIQWYVDQITKWYWTGIEPEEPEDINEEHYLDKIADVLYSLKD
jgi:hypothetical protein